MKVINLCGGPSSGKSTTCAGLFYLMKINNYKVEQITEVAKELVWDGLNNVLNTEQNYILGLQNRKLARVQDKVDYAVVDSPLFFSQLYAPENYFPSFNQFCLEQFNYYDNINILLKRPEGRVFETIGRIHNEDESLDLHYKLENILKINNIPYFEVIADKEAPFKILGYIESMKNSI